MGFLLFSCSALLGAAVVIDRGRDTLWKMQNSGVGGSPYWFLLVVP